MKQPILIDAAVEFIGDENAPLTEDVTQESDAKLGQPLVHDEQPSDEMPTPKAVGELHRRLLSVTTALLEAEAHVSMIAELTGDSSNGAEEPQRRAEIAAELEELCGRLEKSAGALDEVRAGSEELYRAVESELDDSPILTDPGGADPGGTDDTSSEKGTGDDDTVRNT